MKKILCLTLVLVSFAGSAFATTVATDAGGKSIKGGTTSGTATSAPTPLIKFSTGVFGLVNFTAVGESSPGYLIAARHATGSKNFATSNLLTNIYWKQVSASNDPAANLATDVGTADQTGTTFAVGNGWTSY